MFPKPQTRARGLISTRFNGISILAITIGISALTVPFWQSIKAVVYDDLRSVVKIWESK